MTALRALLAGIVDYAGLFPPAGLDMAATVRNYAGYAASDDAWMLGRLVVPAARLAEFSVARAACADAAPGGRPGAWRLSATLGGDVEREVAAVRAFNEHEDGRASVDSVEARTDTPAAVERFAELTPGLVAYAELPSEPDPAALVDAAAACGICAKMRTGGTSVDAFPAAAAVARFARRCVAARVPFKATAGLHHPLRGRFRVTYAPDAPSAVMFGFVNVFLAAALAAELGADDAAVVALLAAENASLGADDAALVALLAEPGIAAFTIDAGAIVWRDRRFTAAALERTREHVARSFGSCSFREPVDELRALVPEIDA